MRTSQSFIVQDFGARADGVPGTVRHLRYASFCPCAGVSCCNERTAAVVCAQPLIIGHVFTLLFCCADPARRGLSTAVVKWLRSCGARTLVYVSCNPSTQASTCHPSLCKASIMQPVRCICKQSVAFLFACPANQPCRHAAPGKFQPCYISGIVSGEHMTSTHIVPSTLRHVHAETP